MPQAKQNDEQRFINLNLWANGNAETFTGRGAQGIELDEEDKKILDEIWSDEIEDTSLSDATEEQ